MFLIQKWKTDTYFNTIVHLFHLMFNSRFAQIVLHVHGHIYFKVMPRKIWIYIEYIHVIHAPVFLNRDEI